MLKIISAPNPVLSQKAKEVKKIDKSIFNFLQEMNEALLSASDPVGVGLAAPQVGKSLQIFITKPTNKSSIQVFINPKIIQKTKTSHLTIDSGRTKQLNKDGDPKKREQTKLEGCLSLQNIWGEVKRDPSIKISYMDEKGEKHTKEFNGFLSTIIQHEVDHLNGILFPKRVLEQKGVLYKSSKNVKG
ncbi:MAG: peptide deformylase, partial [Candidatus Levybacteria bacterium]|nr:peptide deformylase [Candidatus Levybacteria bacterium]